MVRNSVGALYCRMKRFGINGAIRRMERMAAEHGFRLPPIYGRTLEDRAGRNRKHDGIRDNLPGWNVSDYGTGDSLKTGFTLTMLRNGNVKVPDRNLPHDAFPEGKVYQIPDCVGV